MGDNGKPKPLKIPETNTNSSLVSPHPKPLNIVEQSPPVAVVASAPPRRLAIADAPTPVAAPVEQARTIPRTLNIQDVQTPPVREFRQRARTLTDDLVEKAKALEPTIQESRIRGRIDTVLVSSITEILDFGERNLTPLQNTSGAQSKISADLSRIDASGWITRTKEASCKAPSIMDRFTAKPPSYYEGMVKKTRAELIQFVGELERMKKEFFREISDLHLDAVAMIVCSENLSDDHAKMTAHNRGRTLLLAHQTAATLQTTIETSLMQCAQYIQQIDQLLSVTIPQWKMAFGN